LNYESASNEEMYIIKKLEKSIAESSK